MNDNSAPFLSIIVPVYNVEDYLEEALSSILSQNFDHWEVISVNDGSTDSSGELLDYFGKKDERINVYHRNNYGLSATRNYGLKKARGKFVYFLDSDDVILDGVFAQANKMYSENKYQILVISGEYIDEHGGKNSTCSPTIQPGYKTPRRGEKVFVEMFQRASYTPLVLAYFFQRSFLENYSLFFDENYIHEDEAFTSMALSLADRVVSTPDIYYQHRVRPNSIMTIEKSEKNIKGWTKAVSRMLEFVNTAEIDESAKRVIKIRAKSLMNNTLLLIRKLNKNRNLSLSIGDYISSEEIELLGSLMKLKTKFPSIVELQRYLN